MKNADEARAKTSTREFLGQHAPRRGTEYTENVLHRAVFNRNGLSKQWAKLQAKRKAAKS